MNAERLDCETATAAAASPRPLDSPLARLDTAHRALAAGLDRLLDAACGSVDAVELRRRAAAARHLLDGFAPRLHAIEERHVFTALIESMAGSDPVCLREMAAAMTGERRRLDQGWQALRDDVERLGRGDASALDRPALAQFAAAWRAHLARWHTELLPMAERLLDDAALAAIAHAMDEILDERLVAPSEPRCPVAGQQPPS
jgi:hypothetical protein